MEKYPLEQLALIKKRKLDEAERLLKEKKEILLQEENRLATVEAERNTVKKHRLDKLTQLREELDHNCGPIKVQQMKQYLKIVDEQLKEKERRVIEQKKKVEEAQKQVDLARQNLLKRQQDVEKLDIHRVEWQGEIRKEAERKEAVEVDEIGSVRHVRKKRETKDTDHG